MTDGFTRWRKSTRSIGNGECVEVASFRKSSRSVGAGECVEVGQGGAVVAVRDTKDREAGPVLKFAGEAWAAFTSALKADA